MTDDPLEQAIIAGWRRDLVFEAEETQKDLDVLPASYAMLHFRWGMHLAAKVINKPVCQVTYIRTMLSSSFLAILTFSFIAFRQNINVSMSGLGFCFAI